MQGESASRIGQTISHYRLLAELGKGGMGVVYKAQDLVLERLVALKFLAAGRRTDAAWQRLLHEARAASALEHPNICTIYESEETPEGDFFIAMALCEGETLQAKLHRGPLELGEALALTGQVAAGLAHAHARGVVHRDIKPANLILTPAGVKIVDFGIALRGGLLRLTREGAAVGTLAYMSPEQLLGQPVDGRADLWSLGVVLYELLSGCLPFDSLTEHGYAAAVLSKAPESLASRRLGLPTAVNDLLTRLLARAPAGRPSAEDVLRQLRALEAGVRLPGSPAESGTSATLDLVAPVRPALPRPPDVRVHPRVAEIFVGRRHELSVLEELLLHPEPQSVTVCALQGLPGVGKSFLADRFAFEHADRFPGGYLRLIFDPKSPADPKTLLEELADRLGVSAEVGLAERIRERLRYPATLIHLENVDSLGAEVAAGHLLEALRGVTALVTGRLHDLGLAFGWRQVRVATLDEETALSQLWRELGWQPAAGEEGVYRELVRDLGYLPLALHLASGHLRSGRSVTGFLRLLRKRRLDLTPAERAELMNEASEGGRKVLATSFALSVDLLREEIGATAPELLTGLHALGHAPLTGFGRSLGAAIAGLDEEDLEELVFQAQKIGLLLPIPRQERPEGAWRIHPLVAEFLRGKSDPAPVFERMTEWFLTRLPDGAPGEEADQGRRWREIKEETAALAYWLPRVPPGDRHRVIAIETYPVKNGPFHLWIEFCEAALAEVTEPRERSDFLWTLAHVALRAGLLDRGLEAAQEKIEVDSQLRNDHGVETAQGFVGEFLEARGRLEEALVIWQRQLPALERLGEEWEHTATLYKIACVFKKQDRFDEALQLLRERIVPTFEKLKDNRSRVVALGFLADILQAQGDFDAALHIREAEELPLYVRLEESRSRAITIGKIAGILHARGQHEAALRMIQEQEKPVYERLGEARELAVCLGRIAEILHSLGRIADAIRVRESEQLPIFEQLGAAYDLCLAREKLALLYRERRQPGDEERAAGLLRLALEEAERLHLSVADRIRSRLEEGELPEREP